MRRIKQTSTTLQMVVAQVLLSLIFFTFLSKVNAQVTIGSGISPRQGLVLDMNANVSNNTGAGMGLPRAALTDICIDTCGRSRSTARYTCL